MAAVTQAIEALILREGLQAGARLPAERKLAVKLGVSRSRLREAIQQLTSRGIVTSRQGGGTYVADAAGLSLSSRLSPLSSLASSEAGYWQDVIELRKSLDADAAYYAAVRATGEDRARISAALGAVSGSGTHDPNIQAESDAAFHMAIADASHNAVLRQIMAGLFHLLQASISQSLTRLYHLPGIADGLERQHRVIAEAVLAGRADEARRAAHEHLVFVEDNLRPIEEAAARRRRAALALPSNTSKKEIPA